MRPITHENISPSADVVKDFTERKISASHATREGHRISHPNRLVKLVSELDWISFMFLFHAHLLGLYGFLTVQIRWDTKLSNISL